MTTTKKTTPIKLTGKHINEAVQPYWRPSAKGDASNAAWITADEVAESMREDAATIRRELDELANVGLALRMQIGAESFFFAPWLASAASRMAELGRALPHYNKAGTKVENMRGRRMSDNLEKGMKSFIEQMDG